jgi:septal ring factor EnvC (AmiA/AmiB activator)
VIFFAQLPIPLESMKDPDGSFSIVAVLLVGFAGIIAALLAIFRMREFERSAQTKEMESRINRLEAKADACDKDRLALHEMLGKSNQEVQALKDEINEITRDMRGKVDK